MTEWHDNVNRILSHLRGAVELHNEWPTDDTARAVVDQACTLIRDVDEHKAYVDYRTQCATGGQLPAGMPVPIVSGPPPYVITREVAQQLGVLDRFLAEVDNDAAQQRPETEG